MACETERARDLGHKDQAIGQINGTRDGKPGPPKGDPPGQWDPEKIKNQVSEKRHSINGVGNAEEFGAGGMNDELAGGFFQLAELRNPFDVRLDPAVRDGCKISG